jgi:hypothetical protein
MSEIISFSERDFKRTIDVNAKFLLIGNNIDGYVDIDQIIFHSFDELKAKLPQILIKLECSGEWEINLYQITKPYKIVKKYGYFKTPSHGKLLIQHSYMDYPIKSVIFSEDKIQIVGGIVEITENWNANDNEDFTNYEIDFEVIKIKIK